MSKTIEEKAIENGKNPAFDSCNSGLTKREWFAGLAMQGMLANSADYAPGDTESVSKYAFKFADKMLEEGEK